MRIKSLYLKNYRNIDELKIQFSEGLNIFIGPNGQGKTNILESIYLLLNGDSFRFGSNDTFIQFNQPIAYLNSIIETENYDGYLKATLEKSKKKFFLNDKTFTHKNPQFVTNAILFSPESLSIIKESAEERRSLLDDAVKMLIPQGAQVIFDFKKALKTRNKILKDISEKKMVYEEGLKLLDSLNEIYLKLATQVTSYRLHVLFSMKDIVSSILQTTENKFMHKQPVQFDFQYVISDENIQKTEPKYIHEKMQKRLAELQSSECQLGASLVGPQKHDVIFLYNGKDSRFFCSQGQQRSIILAFKMAQIVYHQKVNGFYPVLLLDDVLSELDQTKQEALINYLNSIETQTFLTTTNIDVLDKLSRDKKFKFFIEEGKIVNTI